MSVQCSVFTWQLWWWCVTLCVDCVTSQQGLMVGKLRVSVWVRACAEWASWYCGEYHYAMIASVYHCGRDDLQGCCCSTPDISININLLLLNCPEQISQTQSFKRKKYFHSTFFIIQIVCNDAAGKCWYLFFSGKYHQSCQSGLGGKLGMTDWSRNKSDLIWRTANSLMPSWIGHLIMAH